MRVNMNPKFGMSAAQQKRLSKYEADFINQQTERIVKDAFAKIMWCFAAAAHEEYGFGFLRGARLLEAVREILEQYNGWKKDDAADYLLTQYLRKIGYDIESLYEREG